MQRKLLPDETEDCISLQQSVLFVLLVLVAYATSQVCHPQPTEPVLKKNTQGTIEKRNLVNYCIVDYQLMDS